MGWVFGVTPSRQNRRISGWGFFLQHVNACPAEVVLGDGINHRGGIHHSSPGSVDQKASGRHGSQFLRSNNVCGLGGQGAVETYDIGLLQ